MAEVGPELLRLYSVTVVDRQRAADDGRLVKETVLLILASSLEVGEGVIACPERCSERS